MSGAGLISARLPRSLMEALETSASRAGLDVHEAVRQLVAGLRELTDAELAALPDPPKELDNPRLSLYVGWSHIETLKAVSDRTQLSISDLVRRLLYRWLVDESTWSREIRGLPSSPVLGSGEELDFLFVWAAVGLAVAVVGVVVFWLWLRSRQRKSDSKTPTLPPASEPQTEAPKQ